jgi:hypothetical protein
MPGGVAGDAELITPRPYADCATACVLPVRRRACSFPIRWKKTNTTSVAEGVAADAAGNIYGVEVGPRRMMKYVRK